MTHCCLYAGLCSNTQDNSSSLSVQKLFQQGNMRVVHMQPLHMKAVRRFLCFFVVLFFQYDAADVFSCTPYAHPPNTPSKTCMSPVHDRPRSSWRALPHAPLTVEPQWTGKHWHRLWQGSRHFLSEAVACQRLWSLGEAQSCCMSCPAESHMLFLHAFMLKKVKRKLLPPRCSDV